MTFPAITLRGTFPMFYKIKVTNQLSEAVVIGAYPPSQTTVYRHTPRLPRRYSGGTVLVESRAVILRYYEAFKAFVLPM